MDKSKMTPLEAKEILKNNAVPLFPLQIAYQDWLEAMTMAAEALEKQTQVCGECRQADYAPSVDAIYCMEHSCVMRIDNCCRDWSEGKSNG